MKRTTEQMLEQAYVLIAHLAKLRPELQPHAKRPAIQRQQLALISLLEALQPLTEDDMQELAAEMRKLAAQGLGFKPEADNRGDIIDITELLNGAGLSNSPAALALIRSMQARCEEVTGDKFIGALWAGGGESMRAVLSIGGIRVPVMPALKALDEFIKELANLRAEELIKERIREPLEKVEEVLDHAAAQLKEQFGDPDAEWNEAMEEATEGASPPPGHHKCLKCDTVFNAVQLEVCPECQYPRPVWYNSSEETKP